MKSWTIFFLLIFVVSASAKTYTLGLDDSVMLEGTNITLLGMTDNKDKVLICVNNQKAIVSDARRVGHALIEVKDVEKGLAKLNIKVDCEEDCESKESSNTRCFSRLQEEKQDMPQEGCVLAEDCDDGINCTEDTCEEGRCENIRISNCGNPMTATVSMTVVVPEENLQVPHFTLSLLLLVLVLGLAALSLKQNSPKPL